ncbi:hypothetical protein R1sor_023153 [Riccia sorocarpa]|uniref:Reverse transcriptase zinc-binding domain-containing protein n=1 Tax=Riccia sorocarpa TaxID=122646 RepID=A0ABD3GPX1_9MARC
MRNLHQPWLTPWPCSSTLAPPLMSPSFLMLRSVSASSLLLRHVLAATPIYQLLAVGLTGDGLDELEKLCRQFMWGWNDIGNPKTSLIAWERVAQSRRNGGLGWTRFRLKAEALQIRCLVKILTGEDKEWRQLAKALSFGHIERERIREKDGSGGFEEGVLLGNLSKIKGSPTLSRMFTGWRKILKKNQGTSWLQKMNSAGIFPDNEDRFLIERIEGWIRRNRIGKGQLMLSSCWKWKDKEGHFTWENTTAEWIQRKVWAWKFLQRGCFTGSRAADIGVSNGICDLCPTSIETIDYILWACRHLDRRRAGLKRLGIIPGTCNSIMEWFDFALEAGKRDPSYLTVLIGYIEAVWKERNERIFRGKRTRIPIAGLLKNSLVEIEAYPTKLCAANTLRCLRKAKDTVVGWSDTWAGWIRRTAPGIILASTTRESNLPRTTKGRALSAPR